MKKLFFEKNFSYNWAILFASIILFLFFWGVHNVFATTLVSVSRPGSSLSNSTTSDQDFSSVYTLPANSLVANKVYRITFNYEYVTGSSSATIKTYLKLGSTKIWDSGTALNLPDSITRNSSFVVTVIGTASPGASVAVESSGFQGQTGAQSNNNGIAQPVSGIATNGTLNIVPGVTYSATGSTDSITLLSVIIEDLDDQDVCLTFGCLTGTPTTLSGYGITDAVPDSRELTIDSTMYDLSANRTWTTSGGTLPSQTGNGGLFLTTDGSTPSWASAGGTTVNFIDETTSWLFQFIALFAVFFVTIHFVLKVAKKLL